MKADPQYRAELASWTTPGGVGRRDGVPRQAFGPRDENAAIPLRDFALGHGDPTAVVDFEPDPTLVLLFTAGDGPADWMRAGAANATTPGGGCHRRTASSMALIRAASSVRSGASSAMTSRTDPAACRYGPAPASFTGAPIPRR